MLLTDGVTGSQTTIGVFDPALPGPECRMRPCLQAIEGPGVDALRRCAGAAGEWAALDEVGYLESGCAAYADALRQLLQEKRVMAVVRKQALPLLEELRSQPDAFCVDLDAPYGEAGCVIMASGLGRRFGGNKLLADFGGEPLVMRAIRATEGIFRRRVVVTRNGEVAEICRRAGVEALRHDEPLRSDTVRLGLEAVGDADGCLFCPADQPLLRRETVAALALAAAAAPGEILRPCHEGEAGAPVLFPRWAFGELRSLPAGKGGGYVVARHPDRVRLMPVEDGRELLDADDPAALDRLRAFL